MTNTTPTRHWFITGVSSGFGRELARAALVRGDVVVGTVRQPAQADNFEELAPGRAHAVVLDVTHGADIEPAVQRTLARVGHVDVLVNNAGYGLFGAVEEVSDAEARAVMETNFFGPLAITRALLPHLRERGTGHIFNVSSVAGVIGFPGGGLYSASKFALEGLTEALSAELAAFGIRVTLVEPGGFRTSFSGGSLRMAARVIDGYAETPAAKTRASMNRYAGHEPGDPAKAALAILAALDAPQPPLRLVLGADAVGMVRLAFGAVLAQVDEWEPVSIATALDPH